jgi:hypothetical protein
MKPLNHDDKGCNYTSSDCVIWQGPDIPCIKLCKGDSVSDVINKLATELCDVLETLDISTYDLSCLGISCAPKNFHDFLQTLINIICELQDCCEQNGASSSRTATVTDTVISVAPCFYYTNALGDQVTTMTVTEYVTAIGNRVCNLETRVTTVETTTAANSDRINTLQAQVDAIPTETETLLIPTCVLPAVPTSQTEILQALEQQYCELVSATGSATQIYAAIVKQCTNLANEGTLGGGGGTMGSIPGWDATLLNMAAAMNNIWLTICDMRAAIKNIQANCCPTGCSGVSIAMTATINGSDLVVFLTGTIPSGFTNCSGLGSLVTISDDNGGSFTAYIDVITFLNNPSGYTISMAATPINLSSNIHVHMDDACVTDPNTGSVCKSCLEYTVVNQVNCPAMTYTPDADSIEYTGVSLPGTNSYEVQLWNSLGTVMVATQTQMITSPAPITGTFSGLTINTSYRLRVIVTTASGAITTCPFTPVSLVPTPLLPVDLNGATTFSVLAGNGITNSSGAGTSTFIGDVGSDPNNTVNGIVIGDVTGTLYTAADPIVIAAKTDLTNAIADAVARTPVTTLGADAIGGTTITPGYYDTPGGTISITGNVTLDALGDVNAVFLIQASTTFTAAAAATVTLANGANFANVFWIVGTTTTIGAAAVLKGNILGEGNATVAAGSDIQGRLLINTGSVTTDTLNIYNV